MEEDGGGIGDRLSDRGGVHRSIVSCSMSGWVGWIRNEAFDDLTQKKARRGSGGRGCFGLKVGVQ